MNDLNTTLFEWFHQFAKCNFILDDIGIFFAQYLPYFLVLGFLVYAWRQKEWRLRFLTIAEGILAVILSRGIIVEVFRFFYHHPRPFDALGFAPLIGESGYSFPSGHTSFFFALAMAAFYLNRKFGVWFLVLAAINGLARIYVGVHWPFDILGGVLVGVLCGIVVHALIKPTSEELRYFPERQEVITQ